MVNRRKWVDVHSPVPTDNPNEKSEKHSVTGITLNNDVYATGYFFTDDIFCFLPFIKKF